MESLTLMMMAVVIVLVAVVVILAVMLARKKPAQMPPQSPAAQAPAPGIGSQPYQPRMSPASPPPAAQYQSASFSSSTPVVPSQPMPAPSQPSGTQSWPPQAAFPAGPAPTQPSPVPAPPVQARPIPATPTPGPVASQPSMVPSPPSAAQAQYSPGPALAPSAGTLSPIPPRTPAPPPAPRETTQPAHSEAFPSSSWSETAQTPTNVASSATPPRTSYFGDAAPASPAADMRHFTKKIILIGDGGVGKTTLIRKFVYDTFDDKYIQTIGTKVSKKKVVLPDAKLDVSLMVWDVQGQRNDPLLTRYFAGAEGALFVCDLTRFQTFENLPEWIKDFDAMCGNVPKILLGNKADLLDSAQFGESELAALAARYNALAYLTSAKTGANVEKSFNDLARAITA